MVRKSALSAVWSCDKALIVQREGIVRQYQKNGLFLSLRQDRR